MEDDVRPAETILAPHHRPEVLKFASCLTTNPFQEDRVLAAYKVLLGWLEQAPTRYLLRLRLAAMRRQHQNRWGLYELNGPTDDPDALVEESADLYHNGLLAGFKEDDMPVEVTDDEE